MNFDTESTEINETAWIKAYAELMGVNESAARSVYMFTACTDDAKPELEGAPEKSIFPATTPIESDKT